MTLQGLNLSPLYVRMPEVPAPPPSALAPFTKVITLKNALTPSSMLTYAVAGGIVGYFTGQGTQLAAIGAIAGGVKDLVPAAYHQLPDDVKELAKETTNIGLLALGTYGIYHMLPESLSGLTKLVPNVPAALKTVTDAWSASNTEPRSLDALLKTTFLPALQLTNSVAIPALQSALTTVGFGDHKKFVMSLLGSYASIKALDKISEHPKIKPTADVVKGFANDRAEFARKLFDVAAMVSALPLLDYLRAVPVSETEPTNLLETVISMADSLRYLDTYPTLGVAGLLFFAHMNINNVRHVPSEEEKAEAEEISLETLLTAIGEAKDAILSSSKVFSNYVARFEDNLKPLKAELDRAILHGNITEEAAIYTKIFNEIDKGIADLNKKYTAARTDQGPLNKNRATLLILTSSLLDLKIGQLKSRASRLTIRHALPQEISKNNQQLRRTFNQQIAKCNDLKQIIESEIATAQTARNKCDTDAAKEKFKTEKITPLAEILKEIDLAITSIGLEIKKIKT